MTLRIGRIAYLNVAPYFHYLQQEGFAGEIVSGVPSALNTMLADGAIDACPSSSYEYGLHADEYYLLPDNSISSVGPVHSVLLFTPGQVLYHFPDHSATPLSVPARCAPMPVSPSPPSFAISSAVAVANTGPLIHGVIALPNPLLCLNP